MNPINTDQASGILEATVLQKFLGIPAPSCPTTPLRFGVRNLVIPSAVPTKSVGSLEAGDLARLEIASPNEDATFLGSKSGQVPGFR